MLRILLVSNWYGLRQKAIKEIARTPHKLVGIIIKPWPWPNFRQALGAAILSRLPNFLLPLQRYLDDVLREKVKVHQAAKRCGASLYEVADINSRTTLQFVQKAAPDLILALGWPNKFHEDLLQVARLGCVNVHPSLLPDYRGSHPIPAVILAGERETGVTFHLMNNEYDQGDILLQKKIDLDLADTSSRLLQKTAATILDSLVYFLDAFERNELPRTPQEPGKGSHTPRLSTKDAAINWHESTQKIDRAIRALGPWFTCHSYHGNQRVEIITAKPATGPRNIQPGQIIYVDDSGFRVATADGCLNIYSFNFYGLTKSASRRYLRKKLRVGDILTQSPS